MMSMMNATDTHAETPFWGFRGRFHTQALACIVLAELVNYREFRGIFGRARWA
jgi:hypothetical protein